MVLSLDQAEAKYRTALEAYRRAQARLAAAKREVTEAKQRMPPQTLLQRRSDIRHDILARWLDSAGQAAPGDIAAATGQTLSMVKTVIAHHRMRRGTDVPTFDDWAIWQGWSEETRRAYQDPQATAAFEPLALSVDEFRDRLIQLMCELRPASRHLATLAWV